jgi:hypothetical protein
MIALRFLDVPMLTLASELHSHKDVAPILQGRTPGAYYSLQVGYKEVFVDPLLQLLYLSVEVMDDSRQAGNLLLALSHEVHKPKTQDSQSGYHNTGADDGNHIGLLFFLSEEQNPGTGEVGARASV